ncbi:MAG: hypothetical protein DSM106950_35070 [Stigonema ocellatum SAG 48.90 = DSM 106950]|nr:hypothetical protein [Stigonema ocellatum SAG 48.90 = DSM 106950]
MKKALFLLPGAIAVMLAVVPMISGYNNVAVAGPGHEGQWKALNLTADQKTQIKQIRDSAKQQMDAVLTPDQKALQQQARQQHTRPKLNLTDDQKAKFKTIHDSTESQINALLTPTQQQTYQQLRAQRHEHQ